MHKPLGPARLEPMYPVLYRTALESQKSSDMPEHAWELNAWIEVCILHLSDLAPGLEYTYAVTDGYRDRLSLHSSVLGRVHDTYGDAEVKNPALEAMMLTYGQVFDQYIMRPDREFQAAQKDTSEKE